MNVNGSSAMLGVGLAALFVGVPMVTSTCDTRAAMKQAAVDLPAAPPSVAFAIVWPILYVMAAVSLALQARSMQLGGVRPAMGAVGMALVVGVVAVSWAWPAIWTKSRAAGTGTIVALLAGVLAAMPLILSSGSKGVNGASVAMLAPWVAWLVFALGLSADSTKQTTGH